MKAMSETILVVNAGSSSIKFQLFSRSGPRRSRAAPEGANRGRRREATLDRAGDQGRNRSSMRRGLRPKSTACRKRSTRSSRFYALRSVSCRSAIGHRVVHGGPHYSEPTLVDDAVLKRLDAFSPLAPLHQPNNLAPIRAVRARQPQMLQVACFDTAFHRGHPEVADRYALPEALYAEGVRRYGFHGLSYEYIADRLPEVAPTSREDAWWSRILAAAPRCAPSLAAREASH